MIFACMPAYGKDEGKAILLAHSLRQWGGRFSNAVLLILEPETSRLSPSSCEALTRLGATIVPFPLPETALSFPYAQKVFAAAAAEQIAGGELLAWILAAEAAELDGLLPRAPAELALRHRLIHAVAAAPPAIRRPASPAIKPARAVL